jgi:histidyl-tRNA synthetase
MAIGPPTGMRDWLPQDTVLRQRLMDTIGSVYKLYGYLPIDTPAMEDLAVLMGKGGGENEKLLFKILKRGDKLLAAREEGDDLADYGLRFDLTVPLARFVASHQGKLPKVFRRYHIAPVWRADRPQKGRFREFYQCDIDVVGGTSSDYEVEVITATERVLKTLGLGQYRFRISDRRLLPLILMGFGVPEAQIGAITVVLDKLDKVPVETICAEIHQILTGEIAASKKVEAFIRGCEPLRKVARESAPHEFLDGALTDLRHTKFSAEIDRVHNNIMKIVHDVVGVNKDSRIVFDPILVRGLDYYTGPIYEAVVEGFGSSVLGGGRYDGLIGKFAGKEIPAVGCSIGFERILSILQERETSQNASVGRVLLVRHGPDLVELSRQAEELRARGIQVETYLEEDDLGKQLKYAEVAGIVWAVKEVHQDMTLLVRHLPTRQDRTVSVSELQAILAAG